MKHLFIQFDSAHTDKNIDRIQPNLFGIGIYIPIVDDDKIIDSICIAYIHEQFYSIAFNLDTMYTNVPCTIFLLM